MWCLSDLLISVLVLRACQIQNDRQPRWLASREWKRVWKEVSTPTSRACPWEALATTIWPPLSLWFYQAFTSWALSIQQAFSMNLRSQLISTWDCSGNRSLKHRPGGGGINVCIWFFWSHFFRTDFASNTPYVNSVGHISSEHWHMDAQKASQSRCELPVSLELGDSDCWTFSGQAGIYYPQLSYTNTHTHTHTHRVFYLSTEISQHVT